MLNPGFKLLDPEEEQLRRLQELISGESTLSAFNAITNDGLKQLNHVLPERIKIPGIVNQQTIWEVARELKDNNYYKQELSVYGWPQSLIKRIIDPIQEPAIMIFGILSGDGIWAGALAGISQGGLDYLTTFQWLWQDEPEMAARQKIEDFHEVCQAAEKRFGRKVLGVFIYLDEFKKWKQADFSHELLSQFCEQQTAIYKYK